MNKNTIRKFNKQMTTIKGAVMITEESFKKGIATVTRILNDGKEHKIVLPLPSLSGAIIDGNYEYYVSGADIKHAPLTVSKQINIGYNKLESLKNCPDTCESINLSSIESLKTLHGISKYVESELNIRDCKDIESLDGSPSEVQYFILFNVPKLKTLKFAPIADTYRILKCPDVPDEEIDLSKNDKELFHKWLKSGEDFKDFMYKKRGITLGKKFGF